MLLELQDRLADLISEDPYFTGVPVLTERQGDLANMAERELAQLGAVVVIAVAEGEHAGTEPVAGRSFTEQLVVEIGHMPVAGANTTFNAVLATEKAIIKLHGAPLLGGPGPLKWRVVRHSSQPEPGLNRHQLIVEATVQFPKS